MTSYEPSPYGPDAHGASSQSNPYKKPSNLSDNTQADSTQARRNGTKPQPDFLEEITNAFTEAKASISSAFTEMRSESPKSDKQGDDNASLSDAPKTTFDDVKKQFKEMWASRPVRLPSDQGGGGKIAGVAEGIAVRYQIDPDRKSTRLNSSHVASSYAVFCLKKKTKRIAHL